MCGEITRLHAQKCGERSTLTSLRPAAARPPAEPAPARANERQSGSAKGDAVLYKETEEVWFASDEYQLPGVLFGAIQKVKEVAEAKNLASLSVETRPTDKPGTMVTLLINKSQQEVAYAESGSWMKTHWSGSQKEDQNPRPGRARQMKHAHLSQPVGRDRDIHQVPLHRPRWPRLAHRRKVDGSKLGHSAKRQWLVMQEDPADAFGNARDAPDSKEDGGANFPEDGDDEDGLLASTL